MVNSWIRHLFVSDNPIFIAGQGNTTGFPKHSEESNQIPTVSELIERVFNVPHLLNLLYRGIDKNAGQTSEAFQ